MFRLQIKAADATVWQTPGVMEARAFSEAMQVADRMAQACRRTATASCSATRTWVIEVIGEAGRIVYRAPVAWA